MRTIIVFLLGVAVTWSALFVAYYWDYPVGFFLTSIAFGVYVLAVVSRRIRVRATRRAV